MTVDVKKLTDEELRIKMGFLTASAGVELSLKPQSIEAGNHYVTACKSHTLHGPEKVIIGLKISNNELLTIFFSEVYNTNGFSENAYVGTIKTEYGEHKSETLVKIKKTRLWPKNNIYTEQVILDNGIKMIIEDHIYPKHLIFPNGEELYLQEYNYKDCW